jgi:glycosyltransferase involved in cell wall biosynthesis
MNARDDMTRPADQQAHGTASASASDPVVSVVSPFFNRRSWLAAFLGSLERQTFKDFEVIIVDDASSDGLADAVANTESALAVRLLRQPQNKGAACARNLGMDAARGRYIALIDSDDTWHPSKLARQVAQFEAAPDRSRLVGLSRQVVVGSGAFVTPTRLIARHDRVGDYLFRRGGVIQSSMMFMSADLARAARFVDGERGHDDWSFAMRLEALGAVFEMLPEALVRYQDDERPDRLSPRYTRARFDWLRQYRPLLGEKAYFAASAAFASHMSHDSASYVGTIANGMVRGGVSPWRTAYHLLAYLFPNVRDAAVRCRQSWLGAVGGLARRGGKAGCR